MFNAGQSPQHHIDHLEISCPSRGSGCVSDQYVEAMLDYHPAQRIDMGVNIYSEQCLQCAVLQDHEGDAEWGS